MATEARVGGTPGSDINLILVRNPPAWSPAQAFAYALGAPYHMMHDVPLNALPTPKSRLLQTVSGMLKDAWAIEGGEDLLRTLNWLGAEGHRRSNSMKIRSYSLLRRPAVAARREELRDLGQEDPQGLEELGRLDAVQANTDGIRSGVLIGFDAARAVMLARNGWLLGWLSEERLWDYVFDVARDVQHRFTSWADYAADFRISRNFWQGAQMNGSKSMSFSTSLLSACSPRRGALGGACPGQCRVWKSPVRCARSTAQRQCGRWSAGIATFRRKISSTNPAISRPQTLRSCTTVRIHPRSA
jgi:hypothetical protein